MCARYVCYSSWGTLATEFGLSPIAPPGFQRSYNISPGRTIGVIAHGPRFMLCSWGVLPGYATKSPPLINARAETLTQKPVWREAYASRRCVIMADGFYEWMHSGKLRLPWLFRLKSGRPLGMAGLIVSAGSNSTATIITTTPNALVGAVHNRMPAIIRPDDILKWLDDSTAQDSLDRLLLPIDGALMSGHRVGVAVNRVGADGPSLIEPCEGQPELF